MMHKRLVLIRHAHRDTAISSLDNGLSEKGKKQVKQMIRFAQERELEDAVFLSSPKKRCIETVTPLADLFRAKVKIEAMVGEGGPIGALENFVSWWKREAPETTVACSHGDVIPMLVEQITGAKISIKKAGWCELELVDGDVYLTWLVQSYSG